VIQTSGDSPSERKNAASVLRLLKRGKHWVLVTLLLSNVITNETLPIILDRSLGGGWPAVLGSTVLIGNDEPFSAIECLLICFFLPSYLRRNRSSVNMRPLRSPYRCLDGSLCPGSDVYHGSCCLAGCEIARQTAW
jgi:hypothetical protein